MCVFFFSFFFPICFRCPSFFSVGLLFRTHTFPTKPLFHISFWCTKLIFYFIFLYFFNCTKHSHWAIGIHRHSQSRQLGNSFIFFLGFSFMRLLGEKKTLIRFGETLKYANSGFWFALWNINTWHLFFSFCRAHVFRFGRYIWNIFRFSFFFLWRVAFAFAELSSIFTDTFGVKAHIAYKSHLWEKKNKTKHWSEAYILPMVSCWLGSAYADECVSRIIKRNFSSVVRPSEQLFSSVPSHFLFFFCFFFCFQFSKNSNETQ